MDLFAGMNGAIAGLVAITAGPAITDVVAWEAPASDGALVAITAGPAITDHWWAIIIGAVGGSVCTVAGKVLEKFKIDDVVGAIPAHLASGIWGTLAVTIAAGGRFHIQLLGVVSVGVFVFVVSYAVWRVMDAVLGIRVSPQVERLGQDAGELGIETTPSSCSCPRKTDQQARPSRYEFTGCSVRARAGFLGSRMT